MTNTTINVVSATQVGDHMLKIEFDDKTVQEVDFGPFLKRSRHPDVRAYLQPERFSSFHVVHGELVWGDYDMCFPVIDLYRNSIEHLVIMAQGA
jgi:hypothetical protein